MIRGRTVALFLRSLVPAVLVVAIGCQATPDANTPAVRSVDGVVLTSTDLPAVAIRLPDHLEYIGRTAFVLDDSVADVDRHHFVEIDSTGALKSMAIVHFETILPSSEITFHYSIPSPPNRAGPDFRFADAPVRMGAHDYIHNTWFLDPHESVRQAPNRELGRTASLLSERGVELPSGVQMARFVRVVDSAGKSEIILFYFEPLEATGLGVADYVEGGAGALVFDSLSAALSVRAEAVFVIERG